MSVQRLADSLKAAVDKRISNEARAMRGTIRNGMFVSGAKSFPFKQAVDCSVFDGSRVWAQRSTNGKAIIVGA